MMTLACEPQVAAMASTRETMLRQCGDQDAQTTAITTP